MNNTSDTSNMESMVQEYIQESMAVQKKLMEEQGKILVKIAQAMIETLQKGGTIYICGNGGSAADAQHAAAELVGRFLKERRPLPALAMTTNTSLLTAIGNDYGFQEIFVRQVQAMVTKKDMVVGISTSGKSENILKAIQVAKEIGALTIGFTGMVGRPLSSVTDLCLCVPSQHTPYIQEAHILCWHLLCKLVDTVQY